MLATACSAPEDGRERVLLVTTHSVEDSGLLESLTDGIHVAHPDLRLTTTAVGSGAALALGRRGDADLLLTHDPAGERRFMEEGHGLEQGLVMENEFLLLGPPSDPAGVRGTADVAEAFQRLARTGGRFLSRGDDSGTHRKERALWREAGLEPWTDRPEWYIEAGLGMGETLQTGNELRAYVLTDEATYGHLRRTLDLEVMSRGDPRLRNTYVYTLPRRQRNPAGARAVAQWLIGPGQAVIARHGVEATGGPLFRARAGATPAPAPAATD